MVCLNNIEEVYDNIGKDTDTVINLCYDLKLDKSKIHCKLFEDILPCYYHFEFDIQSDDDEWYKDDEKIRKYCETNKLDVYEIEQYFSKAIHGITINNDGIFSYKFIDEKYWEIIEIYLHLYFCDEFFEISKHVNSRNVVMISDDDQELNDCINIFCPRNIKILKKGDIPCSHKEFKI